MVGGSTGDVGWARILNAGASGRVARVVVRVVGHGAVVCKRKVSSRGCGSGGDGEAAGERRWGGGRVR